MKEYSVIFNAKMVSAALDGRKTQHRQVVKEYNPRLELFKIKEGEPYPFYFRRKDACWDSFATMEELIGTHCPGGQVGDRLWVKEAWAALYHPIAPRIVYRSDYLPLADVSIRWKSSVHMPREASRIIFEIVDIRLQRVQEITEEEAIAEGSYLGRCSCLPAGKRPLDTCFSQKWCHQHGDELKVLWDSRHSKKYLWDWNPWVWVKELNRVET